MSRNQGNTKGVAFAPLIPQGASAEEASPPVSPHNSEEALLSQALESLHTLAQHKPKIAGMSQLLEYIQGSAPSSALPKGLPGDIHGSNVIATRSQQALRLIADIRQRSLIYVPSSWRLTTTHVLDFLELRLKPMARLENLNPQAAVKPSANGARSAPSTDIAPLECKACQKLTQQGIPHRRYGEHGIKLPFLIAQSELKLFGNDSAYSTEGKLPEWLATQYGPIDLESASKGMLLNLLKCLMLIGNGKDILHPPGGLSPLPPARMLPVAMAMVDYFAANKVYGYQTVFTSPALDAAVGLSWVLKEKAEKWKEITSSKKFKEIDELEKFSIQSKPEAIKRFSFNQAWNFLDGLLITVDTVSYVQIYVDGIIFDVGDCRKVKSIDVRYVLYDTYGLDLPDIKKYGAVKEGSAVEKTSKESLISNVFGGLFNAWWLLQYKHGCVPFIVKAQVRDRWVLE